MNLKMYLWVTSSCNLRCPLCNQSYALAQNKGYSMGMDELSLFVKASQDRGIHYYTIELTGGEVSLWPHFEEAVKLIYDSGVCDKITLATNGNSPETIIKISPMLDYWVVSKTQATVEQIKKYKEFPHKVFFNTTPHKKAPGSPMENILPAVCCCSKDLRGVDYEAFLYLRGKIFYCHFAPALGEWVDLAKDGVSCDFSEDFIAKWKDKKYDKIICTYCLCNRKVWEKLPKEMR